MINPVIAWLNTGKLGDSEQLKTLFPVDSSPSPVRSTPDFNSSLQHSASPECSFPSLVEMKDEITIGHGNTRPL